MCDSGQSNISYAGESRHWERAWKNTSETGYAIWLIAFNKLQKKYLQTKSYKILQYNKFSCWPYQ